MCGICGIFDIKDTIDNKQGRIRAMNSLLFHRGPDEEGYYEAKGVHLGIRRLKVIDLVSGSQPIFNEDKKIAVVFNGEIYNYVELRAMMEEKGHRFSTKSDTEVIAHLYEEYQDGFVNKLNGDFAIALWDDNKKKLLLARDRLGIKPLYYARVREGLVFASEIKSLLLFPELKGEIDYRALDSFFSLSYIPAPKTIYRRISKLSPANTLTAQGAARIIRSYWDVQGSEPHRGDDRSEGEILEQLDSLIKDSVKLRLRSDVPLGAMLSSGMDSATIACYASKQLPSPLNTYTITYKEKSYDEGAEAKEFAGVFGTNHHELELDSDIEGHLGAFTTHFDEPFADYSSIPTFFVSRLIKKNITVALSGDGGDEIFGGYPTYNAFYFHRYFNMLPVWLKNSVIPGIAGRLPVSFDRVSFDYKAKQFVTGAAEPYPKAHFLWKGYFRDKEKLSLYSKDLKKEMHGRDFIDIYLRFLPRFDNGNRPITQLMNYDMLTQLPNDFNTKVDMMSMNNSLEVRSPFFDYRLVEFCQALPDDLKVRRFRTKYLLKKLMSTKVPPKLLRIPKRGFTVPLAGWLNTKFRDIVLDTLSPKSISCASFFDAGYVQKLVDDHYHKKHDNTRKIWPLIVFMLWYKNQDKPCAA